MSEVHICWNANREDVITRLAIALTQGTGWTIGKKPDDNARINYFPLYISYAQNPYNKTTVGCWMSHLDKDIPKKVEWWHVAAAGVDIRTTTAPMYRDMLDEQYGGTTHLVQPPVDAQFFSNRKFRIGVSGFVHPGGRKGEGLAQRLHKELPTNWELIASGKGWGNIPQREYHWKELPAYYRSLDVYLCTSLIEGVPMPPLEALACNVPIVIPIGVGMLDQIPLNELSNVYRYRAGDYDDMLRAIEYAYQDITQRRRVAEQYSTQRWIDDHKRAFGLLDEPIVISQSWVESASKRWFHERSDWQTIQMDTPLFGVGEGSALLKLNDEPQYPFVLPATDREPIKGACVVYIAYGKPAREMATVAMTSFKQYMAEDVILISDAPLGIEDVFIEHEDTDIGARSVKTRLYSLIPKQYKYILYLDADTEVLGDISFLFQTLMDGYDFTICLNPPKYFSIGEHRRPDNEEETDVTINQIGHEDMLLYNGGVFAVKRSRAGNTLFKYWHEEWQKWGARDQMALIRAIHRIPLKLCILSQSWNTIVRYVDERFTAGVIHNPQTARRWAGRIDGRLDSEGAWRKVDEFKEKRDE